MEKIKDYFNRYPHNDEVFETDGVLFHSRGAAESYGKETPVRYTREKVMSVTVDGDKDEEDAEKAYSILLETFKAEADITAIKYEALKGYVKGFALETADKKQETLIAALTEFKNTLTVE